MNLDGGGSSTFAVRDPVLRRVTVRNTPSDGIERAVTDGIERAVTNGIGVFRRRR